MHFYFYFLKYIFKSKTRQRLLFIAIAGLLLSSFSLVVIQSIMGGLQNGLIQRSKNVVGVGHFAFDSESSTQDQKDTLQLLTEKGLEFYPEYEIELMLKNGNYVSPAIIHGIDFSKKRPAFLAKKDLNGLVLGGDLGTSLNSYFSSKVQLISPSHVDTLFGDIPRYVTEEVTDFYVSELSEVDSVNAWTRLSLIQNLIKKRAVNIIRFYDEKDLQKAREILTGEFLKVGKFVSWEDQHQSLVWALNLETNVMLFLFVSMSLLVALCITSGFLIFFDKIKTDLISMWVLGYSKKKVLRMSYLLTHVISFLFSFVGLGLGLGFLWLLDSHQIRIMPDFFVERKIPVKFEAYKIFLSFAIPYFIAVVFSYFSFSLFKKEANSFLSLIRKIV